MLQNVYLGALSLACVLALVIGYRAWQNRKTSGAGALVALAGGVALWSGATLGMTVATGTEASVRWLQLSYVGIVTTPVAFVLLAFSYTGYDQYLTRRRVGVLVAAGVALLMLVWTNQFHELYWADIETTTAAPVGITTVPGPVFWVFVIFTYVLLFTGSALLVRYAITAPDLYRTQVVALLIAVSVPWIANVPHALQLMAADFTPVALSITTVTVWIAMFQYRLTTLAPVALRTVFESISSGVYVLDRQHRIVDSNRAGRVLLELDEDVIGEPFTESVPEPLAEHVHSGDRETIIEIERDKPEGTAESQYWQVQVTPVETDSGRRQGQLVVVDDVTDQHRQRQQLEAQNERLQEFTSVVSHDLRNPLNVASGNLHLAQDDCESPHLDTVDQALGRMEALIEDLLALARQGVESTDPEPLALADVATTAWETVDTRAATLHNEMTRTVMADRSRLHQLFENLFRNAVEHGSEGVTITVGELDDGFYVADDGTGIPSEERQQVFESGYTTSEEGTGFGLRIVEQVAEAHGWAVELAESADGGARFEITGVRFTE